MLALRPSIALHQTRPRLRNLSGISTYLHRRYSHRFLPRLSKPVVELKPLCCGSVTSSDERTNQGMHGTKQSTQKALSNVRSEIQKKKKRKKDQPVEVILEQKVDGAQVRQLKVFNTLAGVILNEQLANPGNEQHATQPILLIGMAHKEADVGVGRLVAGAAEHNVAEWGARGWVVGGDEVRHRFDGVRPRQAARAHRDALSSAAGCRRQSRRVSGRWRVQTPGA